MTEPLADQPHVPGKPLRLGRRDSARAIRRALRQVQDAYVRGDISSETAKTHESLLNSTLDAIKVEVGEERLKELWGQLEEFRNSRTLPPPPARRLIPAPTASTVAGDAA